MPKSRVISGDYEGCLITQAFGFPYINISFGRAIYLNKDNVKTYELIDRTKTKSNTYKATFNETYIIAVQFKEGGKSLLEVDEKIYRAIATHLF